MADPRFQPSSPTPSRHVRRKSRSPGRKLLPRMTSPSRTQSLSPMRTSSPRRFPTTPIRHANKRLELTLNKFTNIALPFHLDIVNQHRVNIESLQSQGDWNGVRAEVDQASKSVRQLGALLFEMEVLRSYLDPSELAYFDAKVTPAKTSALVAIHGLQELCPGSPGNFSQFSTRRSLAGTRSNSLSGAQLPRTPESPRGFPFHQRRHSDSETQSCDSLPYSLGDVNNGSAKFQLLSQSPSKTAALQAVAVTTKATKTPTKTTPATKKQAACATVALEAGMVTVATMTARTTPRMRPPMLSDANKGLQSSRPIIPGSPSPQTGTLEVLYEDPKEDSVSLLSGEDVDLISQPLQRPDLDQRKDTLQSWKQLEEEIRDLHELITEFSHMMSSDRNSMETLQNLQNNCRERTSHLPRTAIYPVAGALLGTCLGGPVGLLAGVKIGGLAAIGGSIFGYTTGNVIKEHKDRQDYIDEFYALHPDSRPPPVTRHISQESMAKRAQSLPDVLGDGDGKTRPQRRASSCRRRVARSTDDLLC